MMRKLACLALLGLVSAQSQVTCPQELINARSCDSSGSYTCGADGLTYENACHACRGGINKSYTTGRCAVEKRGCSNTIKEAKCDSSGTYVCGSNGLTYENSCHACKESKMEWFTVGQCSSGKRACSKALKEITKCDDSGSYACGSNSLSYQNSCHACKEDNMEWFTVGQCSSGEHACSKALKELTTCSDSGSFACGKDGLTYENSCNACSGTGNVSYKTGTCSSGKHACSKYLLSIKECGNSGSYACADNGNTYENSCQACRDDVQWYEKGRCTGTRPKVPPRPRQTVQPPKPVEQPPKEVTQPFKPVVEQPKTVIEPSKEVIDYFAIKAKYFNKV